MLDSVKNVNTSNKSAANPYSAFSKLDLTQNRNYLYSVYSQHKTQFYNDSDEKKNKTFKKALITGSVAFTLLGALALAFKGRAINTKDVASKAAKIGNTVKNQTVPMGKKAANDVSMMSLNCASLKDDLWDRFSMFLYEKTPFKFVKSSGDFLTKWYQNNVKKAVEKPFLKAQEAIISTPGGENLKDNLADFNTMFDTLNKSLKAKAQSDRISSMDNLFGGKERKLKNLYSSMTRYLTADKTEDVVKNCANIIEIPENASKELVDKIQQYNKLQLDSLIPKLTEINYGSAPTDCILSAIPVIGFGAALLKTPDKEERKSLMFNLGIPLLPTVLMPVLGTIYPALNGVKALIAGFAVGQVFSQGVKVADKFLFTKRNNNENNGENNI